ncbi:hypothetical protein AURDEDRAFT_175843 [Auricularia subglabra TFB-10046 SS5]|nr:hypothetical protein AURDEDRAFT_175843 [Auricularia subglabra TFB-10046 SS5]
MTDSKVATVIACPTHVTLTSEGTACLYLKYVFKRFGLPMKWISDQRKNTEIEKHLWAWTNTRQDDLSEWLPLAKFAINNRISSATGSSPFFLNHGRRPRMGFKPQCKATNELAAQFAEHMESTWKEAQLALTKAAEQMKTQYDKRCGASRQYKQHPPSSPLSFGFIDAQSSRVPATGPPRIMDYSSPVVFTTVTDGDEDELSDLQLSFEPGPCHRAPWQSRREPICLFVPLLASMSSTGTVFAAADVEGLQESLPNRNYKWDDDFWVYVALQDWLRSEGNYGLIGYDSEDASDAPNGDRLSLLEVYYLFSTPPAPVAAQLPRCYCAHLQDNRPVTVRSFVSRQAGERFGHYGLTCASNPNHCGYFVWLNNAFESVAIQLAPATPEMLEHVHNAVLADARRSRSFANKQRAFQRKRSVSVDGSSGYASSDASSAEPPTDYSSDASNRSAGPSTARSNASLSQVAVTTTDDFLAAHSSPQKGRKRAAAAQTNSSTKRACLPIVPAPVAPVLVVPPPVTTAPVASMPVGAAPFALSQIAFTAVAAKLPQDGIHHDPAAEQRRNSMVDDSAWAASTRGADETRWDCAARRMEYCCGRVWAQTMFYLHEGICGADDEYAAREFNPNANPMDVILDAVGPKGALLEEWEHLAASMGHCCGRIWIPATFAVVHTPCPGLQCTGRFLLECAHDTGSYFIRCEHRKPGSTAHFFSSNLAGYDLGYLGALLRDDVVAIKAIERDGLRRGFGPLAPCTFVTSARSTRGICPYVHRGDHGRLNYGVLVEHACEAKANWFTPQDLNTYPCILLVVQGQHNHSAPPPTYTPTPYLRMMHWLLAQMDDRVAIATPRIFLRDEAVRSDVKRILRVPYGIAPCLTELHPSLDNYDHLDSIIKKYRTSTYPFGTDWEGAKDLLRRHEALPAEYRYI